MKNIRHENTCDERCEKVEERIAHLCPVHTRPRQDVNRKKFAHIDIYDTCDLWRAGVDGIANLISQRLAIF